MLRYCLQLLIAILAVHSGVAQPFRVDTLARAPLAQFPFALAFAPDGSGKLFFTEKNSGRVRVFERSLQPEPFLTVAIDSEGEQGLLGIAFHPLYPDSPYVYLYYTRAMDGSNVLERYRDSSGIGVAPKLLSIVPRLAEGNTNNGGSMAFGPDGKLYLSVGDYGTRPDDAQDTRTRRNHRGKILRLNDDGSLPEDNPFGNKAIWAYGLRNALGISFDPVTGMMYATDGGRTERNEVNSISRGTNLGWPDEDDDVMGRMAVFMGADLPGLSSTLVYRGSAFPRLRGKILFGGYFSPNLWVASLASTGDSLQTEVLYRAHGGFADIKVGPDGSIYLANGPYFASRVLRLVPIAPVFVSPPLIDAVEDSVYEYRPSFQGTPPSVTLVAGPDGMYVDSSAWAVRWTPTNEQAMAGFHTVTLRAHNGAGFSDQAFTVSVRNVNDPPRPFALQSPVDGEVFRFSGIVPTVTFTWERNGDPDGDSLRYLLEVDSLESFPAPVFRDTIRAGLPSVDVALPRRSTSYAWRVFALDERLSARSSPPAAVFTISYLQPLLARVEKDMVRDTSALQTLPPIVVPLANIRYSIRRGGHIRLSVHNLLGQEVAVLVDGTQAEGAYEVEFNRADLPNGIYFYRIQGPDFFETKQFIVSR